MATLHKRTQELSGIDLYNYKKEHGGQLPSNTGITLSQIGMTDTLPTGWANQVGRVVVDSGYKVCLYDAMYGQMSNRSLTPLCLSEGDYDLSKKKLKDGVTWVNRLESMSIQKDCSNSLWIWDKDCTSGSDHTIGDCNDKTSICFQNKVKSCNVKDVSNPECLEFCNQNHGACDIMMTSYCANDANKTKDICACINSPASNTVGANPLCIDSKCTQYGYSTSYMLNKPCPDVTDCNIYYEYGPNINYTDSSVYMRCTDPIKPKQPVIPFVVQEKVISTPQLKEPTIIPVQKKEPQSIPVQKKEPQSIPVQKKEPQSMPVQKKEPQSMPVQRIEPVIMSVQQKEPQIIQQKDSTVIPVQRKEPQLLQQKDIQNNNIDKKIQSIESYQQTQSQPSKQNTEMTQSFQKDTSDNEQDTNTPNWGMIIIMLIVVLLIAIMTVWAIRSRRSVVSPAIVYRQ